MESDRLLVARAALLADKEAFGRLAELYQSPVRRFLFNLTGGDEELSKDLAQETFIKAWLNISSFRAAAKFSTWLYRIAYNTFYDNARNRKRVSVPDDKSINDRTADAGNNKDTAMDIARALSVLKEEERSAMLLFYMEDMPVNKISKIMGCPSGTVKSHLSRGRAKLAAYLGKDGYGK